MRIRELTKSEIECRVSQCGKNNYGAWCNLLLYKDARVDMRILDEIYGPTGWQREHTMIGDRLYCTISIWDDAKQQWIKKQDVGTESNSEPEKGQASDAFKRAGFNVGIGRELYTAPTIRISLKDGEYKVDKDKNGKDKVSTYTKFHVSDIQHNEDGSIKSVTIVDDDGEVRFPKQKGKPQQASASAQQAKKKPMMHKHHEKWQDMLNSVLAGQYTWQYLESLYEFPEADLIEGKTWVLEH